MEDIIQNTPTGAEDTPDGQPMATSRTRPPIRVLFLCTHNKARSQLAEGILRHLGGESVEVFSAGSEVSTIDSDAVRVLASMGINSQRQYSKHMDAFRGQSFEYVITVCDRVREVCPIFPGDPKQLHWSLPDPTAVQGSAEIRYQAFERIARQLETRIRQLLIQIERDQATS